MNTREAILVLGAGPSGLAVAKAFTEAGVPYVQVEATEHVGGNWAHGVYETAHIISSRRTTEYTDHPMPADWPDFPSAAQMHAYYEDYATTYGLRERIRFRTEVTRVVPRDDAWQVTFADGTVETYKGVAVCNGHHWAKAFPSWVRDYTGEVLHSKDYKRPAQLAGRKVLVLGGGNSGCDLVSEAARVAAPAEWSLRRGYWFLPKTLLGTPTVELVKPWMPMGLQRALLGSLVRVVIGRYEDYGLPTPDHQIFETHPTVSSEVFHYLKHGRIRLRPDVVRAEGSTLVFADGSRETYDLVVCATGYDVAFPFLPEGLVPVDGKTPQLYGGMVLAEHRGLYIMGAYQARYGIGPLLRPAAVLLADWVKLQDEIEVPIGAVLKSLGVKPPPSHLMGPFEVLRRIRLAHRLRPLLAWRGRQLARHAPNSRVPLARAG